MHKGFVIDCVSGHDRHVIKNAYSIEPASGMELVIVKEGRSPIFFTPAQALIFANALRQIAREVDEHYRTMNNGAGI